MGAERSSSEPENKRSTSEYCVLYLSSEDGIPTNFIVNPRSELNIGFLIGRKIITEEQKALITQPGRIPRPLEPENDPLTKIYKEKFLARAIEKKGFGTFDAIQVMIEDGWKIVGPLEMSNVHSLLLFRRARQ